MNWFSDWTHSALDWVTTNVDIDVYASTDISLGGGGALAYLLGLLEPIIPILRASTLGRLTRATPIARTI